LPELLDRLESIGGLRYKFHVWLRCDQAGDAVANDGVIIHCENANHELTPAFLRNSAKREPPDGLLYTIEPAMVRSISVPAPAALQIVRFEPICLARSRIPAKPKCPDRPASRIS